MYTDFKSLYLRAHENLFAPFIELDAERVARTMLLWPIDRSDILQYHT